MKQFFRHLPSTQETEDQRNYYLACKFLQMKGSHPQEAERVLRSSSDVTTEGSGGGVSLVVGQGLWRTMGRSREAGPKTIDSLDAR